MDSLFFFNPLFSGTCSFIVPLAILFTPYIMRSSNRIIVKNINKQTIGWELINVQQEEDLILL